jgi:hypothetical protein
MIWTLKRHQTLNTFGLPWTLFNKPHAAYEIRNRERDGLLIVPRSIWFTVLRCTGRISGSVDGRFAEFVGLIDRRLPEELQFSDKDCDIGALISNAVALSSSDTAKFGPTASPLEAFSCTPSRMHGDDKCRQELRFSFAFQAKNSTP